MKGTQEDREKLRSRVKGLLGERTQRDVERALEVSSGTLSRAFGGRKNLDADFLTSLAGELDTEASTLVEGTSFASLLGEPEAAEPAPEAVEPEPEAVEPEVVEPEVVEPEPEPEVVEPEPEPEVVEPEPELEAVEPDADDPEAEHPDANEVEAVTEPATEPRVNGHTHGVPAANGVNGAHVSNSAHNGPGHEAAGDDKAPKAEEAPPPGIGGRVMRFFASIFGG